MHEAVVCMDCSHLLIHEHLSPQSNQSYVHINAKTERWQIKTQPKVNGQSFYSGPEGPKVVTLQK